MDVFLLATFVITVASTILGYYVGLTEGEKKGHDNSRRAINALNRSVDDLVLSLEKPVELETFTFPTEPVGKGTEIEKFPESPEPPKREKTVKPKKKPDTKGKTKKK